MSFIFRKNFLAEIFLEVLANYEYHFTEAGLKGVVNRVIHDGFTVGAQRVELLETAVAATHACSKYKECWFHDLFREYDVLVACAPPMHRAKGAALIGKVVLFGDSAGAVGDDYGNYNRLVAIFGAEFLLGCVDEVIIEIVLHQVDGAAAEAAAHDA